ncbi:MAG: hypothetical protein FI707_14780 [SAR202 cluster bacterium]|nr:hypothetical protein [Chloroflexota bacterium]MQG58195.1 hypothetical protein [SAR202 cluster bacterium]MQG70040.1 hypothetical protein [SAR202 cluster bacterium]HAL47314.1 hypothetical protein [Dehalococcoidia bacterium]
MPLMPRPCVYNVAMLHVLSWLITVEALGLAAFPLAYYLFRRMPDRGFSLAKPLGILIVGYASWILGALGVVPSVQASLIVILVALACVGGWIAWRERVELQAFVVGERRALITAEAIFLVFFVAWTIFRAYDPAIDHTEQPMDHAFLNASVLATSGQPEDPWLRGETISYYYFGYWTMGAVTELSGVPTNYAYNLALALIPALAAMGIFGLVSAMVRSESRRWGHAVIGGVAAGVVLGVVGNLEGVLEFLKANAIGGQGFYDWIGIDGLDGPAVTPTESWTPNDFWWWFRATRVINTFQDGQGLDYTIEEFPFFSFILGDLHPHVSAVPFALLFLGFLWNSYRLGSSALNWRAPYTYANIGVMGLSLGGLAFTNMWDLPTYLVLHQGVVSLKTYSASGWRILPILRATEQTLPVALLAVVLYLPYYAAFSASVEGIGTVTTTTRYPHMFLVWGLPLILVGPFILAAFWRTRVGADWRRITLYSLWIGFAPYVVWLIMRSQPIGVDEGPMGRLWHVIPFTVLIALAVWSAMAFARERGPNGISFALMVATVGLGLIMGAELLYVDDSFGPPSERMNTVFKLYYQAWILLAAASGFAIYYWLAIRGALKAWKRAASTVWAAGAIVLLVGSLYYTAAAAASKSGFPDRETTLDGLAFVQQRSKAEYNAILYVRDELESDAAMLEAVGEWFDAGLISRSTGVPTVFNWPGHEIQWRGSHESLDGREADVARIYESMDPQEAGNLLAKYDVDYVYIGSRERSKYGEQGMEKFPEFMDSVFNQGDIDIYKVRK